LQEEEAQMDLEMEQYEGEVAEDGGGSADKEDTIYL